MTRILTALLISSAFCFPSGLAADTAYSPPTIAQGEGGWQSYVEPLMLDRDSAAGLTPAPDTPEATVVRFLSSRIRGDSAWQQSMVADPGRKTKKALKKWKNWTLKAAQLQSRKPKGDNRFCVRVWFDLSIDGKSETGSDDFTVTREANGWRISELPS